MNWDGTIWIQVEKRRLNNLDHLVTTSAVDRHLIVPNVDAVVSTETRI